MTTFIGTIPVPRHAALTPMAISNREPLPLPLAD